jgi:hypothetical protein
MGIVNGKAMKFFVLRIECSGPDRVRWGTCLAATRSLAANSGKENLLLEHVNVISPVFQQCTGTYSRRAALR